jgi:short-subunit dehydrogenase
MNIFITGGTTGIGLLVGKKFIEEGYNVAVCSFQKKEEIKDLPNGFHYYQADVTDENALETAMKEFAQKVGTLDIVFANAGLNMPKTAIPDTKLGKKVTMVNVVGVVNTFNAALPIFLNQNSGHFVAMASLSALNGLPGMSYYGASKAFVIQFCESLSLDLKDKNIDVTCITPGFVATDFTKNNKNPMPFLMSAETTANKIVGAIKQKREFVAFPKIPYLTMSLLGSLPKKLYYPIMRRDLFNLRYKE